MVRDGILWVLTPLVVALAVALTGYWLLALPFFLLAAFMAYFFRDPRRTTPADENIVISPADGRVTRIEHLNASATSTASETQATGDADSSAAPLPTTVVSIFLSPFDVHINRAPIAGEIVDVTYTKGKFMMATRDDTSLLNEQNALTIRGAQITVVCKQIAGVLARRIVCWKQRGDRLALGERFGLIKFSSRTDLVLPPEVEVLVRVGERVRGGVSIIGRIRDGR